MKCRENGNGMEFFYLKKKYETYWSLDAVNI